MNIEYNGSRFFVSCFKPKPSLENSMLQESLTNCLSLVEDFIEEKKLVLNESIYNWEHIPYNGKDERHYEIVTKNGKKTKRYLHVFIYRHETGRYELNMYTL